MAKKQAKRLSDGKTRVFIENPSYKDEKETPSIIDPTKLQDVDGTEIKSEETKAKEDQERAERQKRLDAHEISLWKENFNTWKADRSRIEEFESSGAAILQPNQGKKVLVEAFFYYPPRGENDLQSSADGMFGFDGELSASQQAKMKSLPFVKVLHSPDKEEIGKIFIVGDGLATVKPNPNWEQWQKMRAGQPSLQDTIKEPPMFITGWQQWGASGYIIDKFKVKPELIDFFTYLISANHLIAELKQ